MRLHFFGVLVLCFGMLAVALFLQLFYSLEPCPLCVLQRIVVGATGILALLAFLTSPSSGIISRIWSFLLLVGGSTSLGVAIYHVWLLNQPADAQASCGPGLEVSLDKFIEYLPSSDWVETLLRSSASCTDGSQKFYGFEIPELILPAFILFFLYLLWGLFRRID